MSVSAISHRENRSAPEHVDVLIVGAGISGIGAAYHLQDQCPDKSFAVLEAYESFGGTWHMHRYPGIRSDSDLYTFGYRFKPWVGAPIASAEEILKYLGEIIDENALDQHIHYQHKIIKASWSSEESLWTIEAVRGDTQEHLTISCNFLWMCQGYYQHAKGYTLSGKAWKVSQVKLSIRKIGPKTWITKAKESFALAPVQQPPR